MPIDNGQVQTEEDLIAQVGRFRTIFERLVGKTSGQVLVIDAAGIPAVVTLSGDGTIVASGALTVGAVVDGARVANVANANVIGGALLLFRIDLAAGANGDTDVVTTHKIRVVDAWHVLTGAGVTSAVYTVKNGATAITDGLAASGADKTISRAATIDDAQAEIAAAGTLRVTGSGGATQPAATMYVAAIRVA